jgi:hypothetical protein
MELMAGDAQRGEERDGDHRPQEPVEVAQAVASLGGDPTKAGSKEEACPEDRQPRKWDGECGIAENVQQWRQFVAFVLSVVCLLHDPDRDQREPPADQDDP